VVGEDGEIVGKDAEDEDGGEQFNSTKTCLAESQDGATESHD